MEITEQTEKSEQTEPNQKTFCLFRVFRLFRNLIFAFPERLHYRDAFASSRLTKTNSLHPNPTPPHFSLVSVKPRSL
jgi:hypothetical protein